MKLMIVLFILHYISLSFTPVVVHCSELNNNNSSHFSSNLNNENQDVSKDIEAVVKEHEQYLLNDFADIRYLKKEVTKHSDALRNDIRWLKEDQGEIEKIKKIVVRQQRFIKDMYSFLSKNFSDFNLQRKRRSLEDQDQDQETKIKKY